MKGRTSFVIAQRISTVLNADQILVLDKGRIVARGTHEELLETSEIYADIYNSQLVGDATPRASARGRACPGRATAMMGNRDFACSAPRQPKPKAVGATLARFWQLLPRATPRCFSALPALIVVSTYLQVTIPEPARSGGRLLPDPGDARHALAAANPDAASRGRGAPDELLVRQARPRARPRPTTCWAWASWCC